MDRNKLEQWILLEQSGELPEEEQRELRAILEYDAEGRLFREDLHRITRTTLLTPLPREVSPAAVDRIVHRGETFKPRMTTPQRQKPDFFSVWNQALAYAAMAVALAVGTWFIIHRWQEPISTVGSPNAVPAFTDPLLQDLALEAELNELERLISTAQQDWNGSENTDLDSLADELLALEG